MRRAALTPFVLPAALGGSAVVVGGVAGFLLGFVGALIGIDRALGFAGVSRIEAERAYRRIARRRAGALAYLPDDAGWAASAPRRTLGVRPIAVDSIAGSTDRHKAESFDAGFRPPQWSRERWLQTVARGPRWRGTTADRGLPRRRQALRARRPPPCVRGPRARRGQHRRARWSS